ncbi:MAG: cation transporter [Deltaproteobacteria bacterium]|nr:cation transporter [Deltaproteobacteria bacterium]
MDRQTLKLASRVTLLGFGINIALAAVKLMAGIIGRSSALIADAVHSLSDLITDVIAILGVRIGNRPADTSHEYGHGKIETLATAIIGIMLFLVGLGLFLSGANKVLDTYRGHILLKPGWVAFYTAIISIVIKEWLYRYTMKTGRQVNSKAIVANAWHHRSDAFSSIGCVVGIGGAILLGQRWRILDPIAAIGISIFIIKEAFNIILQCINELTEKSLGEEMEANILRVIMSVPGVKNPHNLKTRSIGNAHAIDVHIEVDSSLNIVQAHDISSRVEERLRDLLGKETFISVHVEPPT